MFQRLVKWGLKGSWCSLVGCVTFGAVECHLFLYTVDPERASARSGRIDDGKVFTLVTRSFRGLSLSQSEVTGVEGSISMKNAGNCKEASREIVKENSTRINNCPSISSEPMQAR